MFLLLQQLFYTKFKAKGMNKAYWYENWFDSKYYHILYKSRDTSEANHFIKNLINKLNLEKNNRILDVACGKGRHSIFLNSLGFQVTGIDLSNESINFCKKFQNDSLSFHKFDMRNCFKEDHFNLSLNLFTSIGYFDDEKDNFKVIKSMTDSVKKNCHIVIDFFNVQNVIKNLVSKEKKQIDDVIFLIKRYVKDNKIIKEVRIIDNDLEYSYCEKVSLLELNYFKNVFNKLGIELVSLFGNYSFDEYQKNSERLILFGKKS
mgnify:FL=1